VHWLAILSNYGLRLLWLGLVLSAIQLSGKKAPHACTNWICLKPVKADEASITHLKALLALQLNSLVAVAVTGGDCSAAGQVL
jgi:hypothetical protein